MAFVIGLDLGNYNSFPSFIEDVDLGQTRRGGRPVDLLPSNDSAGIPSYFFYNKDADGGPRMLAGRAASGGMAKPSKLRVRCLKRHLGKPLIIEGGRVASEGEQVVIDGKPWLCDDALKEVVQSIVREANGVMKQNHLQTTNLISLAYPATYDVSHRERLVQIVESATLEDGRHLKVWGTIPEPAAAALDYLDSRGDAAGEQATVLVFDLGGGTFDLAHVTCYPQGRRRRNGGLYFYDFHMRDADEIGGFDFDDIMHEIMCAKLEAALKPHGLGLTPHLVNDVLRAHAEGFKKDLSDAPETGESFDVPDPKLANGIPIVVRREEFENHRETRKLIGRMVAKTKALLEETQGPRPEAIVLSGGASQMPMVGKALAEALPAFRDKIVLFRPEKAISYGAARFGAMEPDDSPEESLPPVNKRSDHDIGVRYFTDEDREVGYIETFIPAGTELPFESEWQDGYTLQKGDNTTYKVYEARGRNPNKNAPEGEYKRVMQVVVEFGRVLPKGTPTQCRLRLDYNEILWIEAREREGATLFRNHKELVLS